VSGILIRRFVKKNPAFQQRISDLTGIDLRLDGDQGDHDDPNSDKLSQTELALKELFSSLTNSDLQRSK